MAYRELFHNNSLMPSEALMPCEIFRHLWKTPNSQLDLLAASLVSTSWYLEASQPCYQLSLDCLLVCLAKGCGTLSAIFVTAH